ncbi:MAG: hypothetical protein M3Y72_16450 [Acidobacteriota bacterium]|nr:hypothetical protein [Acidobacteriota bacterium]
MLNGYGVFTDHRKRRDELLIARDAFGKAIALIVAAPLPNAADYDQL